MSCLVDIHRFTMINAGSKFRHLLRKGFDLLHPSAAGAMVMGTWTFRSRKAVDFVCGELDSWTGRSGSRLIQLCGKGVKPCALIKEVRIVGTYRTQNPVLTRDTPKLAIILAISLILGKKSGWFSFTHGMAMAKVVKMIFMECQLGPSLWDCGQIRTADLVVPMEELIPS